MKEIEVLVQVYESKDSALAKLQSYNFTGTKSVIDIYYCDQATGRFKANDHGRLTESLRVRQKESACYLTYKLDHFTPQGVWTYSDEHETAITNAKAAALILKNLGFSELVTIHNLKHTYLTDTYEIVLEEVKDLGLFLEVEQLHTDAIEDVHQAKQKIHSFIKNLNLHVSPELNAGKPELMLKNKLN